VRKVRIASTAAAAHGTVHDTKAFIRSAHSANHGHLIAAGHYGPLVSLSQ
jgi:hypothetical protein